MDLESQTEPYSERIEKSKYGEREKKQLFEETKRTVLNKMIDQILLSRKQSAST